MSSRLKKILLLAAAGALLTANGFLLPLLNRERAALGVTRIEPLENAPPMLALTTQVLGGFRGLIANALWIRMSKLQEDGKYFEMVQLADWITKLEPHIVQVWIVQSWNMSFNISVKFSDHSDRWRWVQRGMELLRDEAIRYNPDQPLLYAELSWLFQFKMGQNLDDAHFVYKYAWAREMTNTFGGDKPNFDQLTNPQTPDERERSRLLREKYKMDPAKMLSLNERYGPLDWRLPEAHAIYWSSVGMDHAKGEDVRRLRSGVYQSMHLAYQRGRLVMNSNTFSFLPNLDIIPKVDAAYQEQIADAAVNYAFLTNNMTKAWRNFLRDVPYQFFIYNRVREGEQWLRYLREKFPDAVPPGATLAEYAVNRVAENITGQSQARTQGLIEAMLTRAYYSLVEDNADESNEYMLRAAELWNAHTRQTKGNQRIELTPLDELKDIVLKRMLGPEGGLAPEEIARLRTMVPRAAQLSPVNASQPPK